MYLLETLPITNLLEAFCSYNSRVLAIEIRETSDHFSLTNLNLLQNKRFVGNRH